MPWSQERFEGLVAKWVAACDQPFTAVATDEFCEMLQYVHHHAGKPLEIPSPDSVKTTITKLSTEMVEGLKKIFKVWYLRLHSLSSINNPGQENTSDFVLSLDAWTSNNGCAFLAIIVHYIGNDGELGVSLSVPRHLS